jgi:hypothetical protein
MIFAAMAAIALAGADNAGSMQAPIAYCSGNVVLVGRVERQKFVDPAIPAGLFGDAPLEMVVRVKRVLHGQEMRKRVKIGELTHVTGRIDHDFLFILTRQGDQYGLLNKVWLERPSDRPTLKEKCPDG